MNGATGTARPMRWQRFKRSARFKARIAWARTGYRPTARLLHWFDLHHTRRIGPMEDGAIIHKCEWCGVSRVDHTMESIRRKMEAH